MRRSAKPVPTIIHEDAALWVVDKPAGVASIPGRGASNLVDLLKFHRLIDADEEPRIVHRLDRGASGVMVLARTLEVQRFLHEQWARRRVEKVYLALVCGHVAGETVVERGDAAATGSDEKGREYVIDIPLRIDRDKRKVEPDPRRGKRSVTRYRVVEHLGGHTLLECRPVTGRLHQIRVHLAAIGHPLGVDPSYGGGSAIYLSHFKSGYRASRTHKERALIDRLTLHALRITFKHPSGGGPVTFDAPVPKDLRATIRQLQRAM